MLGSQKDYKILGFTLHILSESSLFKELQLNSTQDKMSSDDQVTGHLQIANADESVKKVITHRETNVKSGFSKALVLNQPASFWVLYDKPDYDYGGKSAIRVDDKCNYGKDIRSVQGFNRSNPGIVLFQGYDLTGLGKEFAASTELSSETFPPTHSRGVSSFIVTGGRWQMKDKDGDILGIEGGQTVFPKGQYHFPAASNDKAAQLELLDD